MSPIRTPGLPGRPASVAHLGRTLCLTRTQDWQRNTMAARVPAGRSDGAERRARAGAYHRCPAGSAPRHPGVPSANEDRLVVTDALGTTIKSTSMATWRCPLAWASSGPWQWGSCSDLYIRSAVVTCLELCCSPSRASSQRTGSLGYSLARPGARLRNVNAAARPQRLQARLSPIRRGSVLAGVPSVTRADRPVMGLVAGRSPAGSWLG
jgi:hypothetical protein